MSTTTSTNIHNPAQSIRASLDWLADNGHIEWDTDWYERRTQFFAALQSWEEHDSSVEQALKVAFDGVDQIEQIHAVQIFWNVFNTGILQEEPKKKRRNPLKLVTESVDKTREALAS